MARAPALPINFNVIIILLPICRNLISKLRGTGRVRYYIHTRSLMPEGLNIKCTILKSWDLALLHDILSSDFGMGGGADWH